MRELIEAARRLMPAGVSMAWADPNVLHPLLPGEDLRRAVPKRLAEFSAGRAAARKALGAQLAIPHGADRAPVWPAGVVGSISHSGSDCLAAVTRALRGLGLDIEPDLPLEEGLWPAILTGPEREFVMAQAEPGRAAMAIFSAKEAAYKAQYPLSRQVFGFERMQVSGAEVRFLADTPPFLAGDVVHLAQTRAGGHVISACWF